MEKVSLNLLSVSSKARSKCELYKIMTVDGHLYLPPYKYWTIEFMADIIEESRVVSLFLQEYTHITFRLLKPSKLSSKACPTYLVLELRAWLSFLFRTVIGNDICLQSMPKLLYRDWIANLCKCSCKIMLK